MIISGFTMVKNADKLNYPFEESVKSLLPIVDEMVIALGDCDEDDNTINIINRINSSKIKIVHTKWEPDKYPNGTILAQQTDIAKSNCSGDWLFYLQADEVIHENDYDLIRNSCDKYLNDNSVEGFLFSYVHFWGDYDHAFTHNHAWYRHEIRIIRNEKSIHSWRDAQTFRKINDFSKEKYMQKDGTEKLSVIKIEANIYHYGWVHPPKIASNKQNHFSASLYGRDEIKDKEFFNISEKDFGPLGLVPLFVGTHPAIMKNRIKNFNWSNQLNYSKKQGKGVTKQKHNKFKYRLITFIEQLFFKEFGLFTFKNYNLLKNK
ncbi:MAG: hypothetical protein JW717_09985 [Marinilabiliaceae bacterium]|nr:hypothetical protein [Marinilabiliaceae bacterium]